MELTEQERICALEKLDSDGWTGLLSLLSRLEEEALEIPVDNLKLIGRQPGDTIRDKLHFRANPRIFRLHERHERA